MKIVFDKATMKDFDEVARLFDELHDYLSATKNYPGWKKGVYPVPEVAEAAIAEQSMYVARIDGRIAGTFVLLHVPEPDYETVDWHCDYDYDEIIVFHTFCVHPDFLRQGVGQAILEFVIEKAKQDGMKAIRLDVYEGNLPAIRLYEKCGFSYIATLNKGYAEYKLPLFKLFQRLL